ncbi:MAG: HAD-IC family P-type ATPase [Candidatus Moranbacteria bacterium]|nr:HAD-IC family P-type ATPase [Candidatus Moranbacteria bacterium]
MASSPWHTYSAAQTAKKLETSLQGLSSEEAASRQRQFGLNVLPQKKSVSNLTLFLRQFKSPLMYILSAVVVVSFFMGNYSDSIFVILVVLVNTTVGFYQERKANESLKLLKRMVGTRVKVLRDGGRKEIGGEDLVPGDVVFLRAGDSVPADARLIKVNGLNVNEASLTGESREVVKETGAILDGETEITARKNMVFAGTTVEQGEAKAIVVATGNGTEFGRVVKVLAETEEPKTPVQKKIAYLSKFIGFFVVTVAFALVILGYYTEKDLTEVFSAALALSVSAIPEGLLPAITIILVFAMKRVLGEKGVVKRLSATEALGSVTVVCTDKTGTLTEGEMKVSRILTGIRDFSVRNLPKGFGPLEKISGSRLFVLEVASLANEAYFEKPGDELHQPVIRGRFTEKALLEAGIQSGLDLKRLEENYPLVKKVCFNSDLKLAFYLRKKNKDERRLFSLGAPEKILAKSNWFYENGKTIRLGRELAGKIDTKINRLSAKGLRLVACAYRDFEKDPDNLEDSAKELVFVGLVALKDPVRNQVKETVEKIKKAGIKLIMVTGDHKNTAWAIAKEVGMAIKKEEVMEGAELMSIADKALQKRIRKVKVFARVLPEQKLKIIKALHGNGEVVAMFGDGINDTPALKASDVSVVVGSGTDIAKEVADLILLDNNFNIIDKAIEQGRLAFENIKKVFIYLVADDFSEVFVFLGAAILGLPLPLLPAQILWINLVEDSFPDIALTTEKETDGLMKEKPRKPNAPIIGRDLKKWMAAIFLINGLAAFLLYLSALNIIPEIERVRTLVFALIAFDSLTFAFCVRSLRKPVFRKDIFSNYYLNAAAVIGMTLLFLAVYLPAFQKITGTVPLGIVEWLIIILVAFLELLAIEIFKKFFVYPKRVT